MIQRLLLPSFVGTIAIVLLLAGFTEKVGAQQAPVTTGALPEMGRLQQPISVAQIPTPTATPDSALSAPIGLISPTLELTATDTITPESPSATPGSVITGSGDLTATQSITAEAASTSEDEPEEEVEPLTGTILSNRGNHTARFFVEGQTIELDPTRATSFDLQRTSTVLNLYNCAASTPESNADCYWDPYILQRDGFYEIYQSRPAGVDTVARLMLRAADAPPTDQIWVQNRSANMESIVYNEEIIELMPAAVHEFAVDSGMQAILYVRSCILLEEQSACEWSPKRLDPGIYYSLSEVEVAGALAGSRIANIVLRPVVGASEDIAVDAESATETESNTPATSASADTVTCRVLVPALNIRSGPGLQYEIIGKIFSSQDDPSEVRIIGRNADNQWLVVDPAVMPDGWVTGSDSFILCDNDFTQLTAVAAPPLPVAPAPAPVVEADPADGASGAEAPGDESSADAGDETGEETAEETVAGEDQSVPEGYALLIVHNGFQHAMRFTIDQRYRFETGPSEIDLEPGTSQNVVVFPGAITFTVSTPWGGGLSDNALIEVEADSTENLWLRFEADGSDSYRLNW